MENDPYFAMPETCQPVSNQAALVQGAAVEVSYAVAHLSQLGQEEFEAWEAIRSNQPMFRSPFFSSKFSRMVDQIQSGIEVGLVSCGSELVGILPFRRSGKFHARPPGAGINDAHCLIGRANLDLHMEDVLAACELQTYAFHAAPQNGCSIADYSMGTTKSYLADLTVDPNGYEQYLCKRNRTIDKQAQKTRKLERTVGQLRFEFDCRDASLLSRLIELKRQQYQRTHTFDIFSVPWICQLMQRLHESESDEPRGLLSVLFAGEMPVAMHYGLLEGSLLHYWFPVYDSDYQFASPGTQLFLEVARECSQRGINAIDLGYGEQPYKNKLTNVVTEMSFGRIDQNAARRAIYRCKVAIQRKAERAQAA